MPVFSRSSKGSAPKKYSRLFLRKAKGEAPVEISRMWATLPSGPEDTTARDKIHPTLIFGGGRELPTDEGWWRDNLSMSLSAAWVSGEVQGGWWSDNLRLAMSVEWEAGAVDEGWWRDNLNIALAPAWAPDEAQHGWWRDNMTLTYAAAWEPLSAQEGYWADNLGIAMAAEWETNVYVGQRGSLRSSIDVPESLDLNDLRTGGVPPFTDVIVTDVPGTLSISGSTLTWIPNDAISIGETRTATIRSTDSSPGGSQVATIEVDCTRIAPPPPPFEISGPSRIDVLLPSRDVPSTDYSGANGTDPYTWTLRQPAGVGLVLSSTAGTTTALSGTLPSGLGPWTVTVVGTDADGESDEIDVTISLTRVRPNPTVSVAPFVVAPGASDSSPEVISNDPGGTKTRVQSVDDTRFSIAFAAGSYTVTAPADVPRGTTTTARGTVTFPDGFEAPWEAVVTVPCLAFTARGGSSDIFPGGDASVAINAFGGCPGTTSTIERKSGDVDPSWLTATLDGTNVDGEAIATAPVGSRGVTKWIVTPSSGTPVEVDVIFNVVARRPTVRAPDITVPTSSNRTGDATVADPGGTGAFSIENADEAPDWITSLGVNSTGRVSVSRGTGGTDGDTFDYVLRWTPDDASIRHGEDTGTITAGVDPLRITGPAVIQSYRGEDATGDYPATGGSEVMSSVEVIPYGDHSGVSIIASLTGNTIGVIARSTSAATANQRYVFGLRVTDSAGRRSEIFRFAYRVRCPAVSVNGNTYEGQDAGTDVDVEWDITGDCDATGTVALVGSYPFEVTAPVKSGRKITATVSIPADTVAGTELQKIVVRYTSATESDNTDTGECTIVVGDPVECNLPARFDVADYGLEMNRQINTYVSGISLYSVDFDGTAPAGITLTGRTNFARGEQATYVLHSPSVTGDTTVNLVIRDSNGRRVGRCSTVVGIGSYGCTQAWEFLGAAGSGFMGFYLYGRKKANQVLNFDIPATSPSASLVRVAPHLETQYDAALVGLKLSLDDLGIKREFTVNIIEGSDTSTILGTCSGSYTVVPIFELSFTRRAIKRGTTAVLVLTSFPPTSDPRIEEGSLRVDIKVGGGDPPAWITWTQAPGGSPVNITLSPPPTIEVQDIELSIGVTADFTLEGLEQPTSIEFRYESPASEFINTKRALVRIGIVSTEPPRLTCFNPITTASVDHAIQREVNLNLGIFVNLTEFVYPSVNQTRPNSQGIPVKADGFNYNSTVPGNLIVVGIWNAVTIRDIARAMENNDVSSTFFSFTILAEDSLNEFECRGEVNFVFRE